jgi:hypothetical protein
MTARIELSGAVVTVHGTPLAYRAFLDPMPLWGYWYLLLLPLCVAVAVVYKSVKCATMREVPVAAAKTTVYILIGMAIAAAVLAVVVKVLERS